MTISKLSTSRLMLLPMLALVALTLQACAVSAPSSSVGIDLPPLPAKLVSTSCVPGVLPDRALTKAEVEKLWARDRVTLSRCGYTVGGLIGFYEDLSRKLRAAKTR